MRIKREESIAVVVDIQERLLPHISEGDILLSNSLKLIDGLKVLAVPFIITQQYTRGLGPTHPDISARFPGIGHVEKISFSCCGEPSFTEKLKNAGKKNVILLGIETHVCVLQTCLDLLESGYIPVVVQDCVSSRKASDRATAFERMRKEGAIITTYESLLFELTVSAGTDTFKAVSAIVK
jgi:nicotinamidase-related amidase